MRARRLLIGGWLTGGALAGPPRQCRARHSSLLFAQKHAVIRWPPKVGWGSCARILPRPIPRQP
eukprot:8906743-Pyramimonas_sp.AAC.1